MSPGPTSPHPCLPAGSAGSHLIGVCVVGGGGILSLRLIHGALGCPHGCILGCLLHVRVLPCSCGPLLLSFAETPPTAPVEFMNLYEEEHKEGLIKKVSHPGKTWEPEIIHSKTSPPSHPCSVHINAQSTPSHSRMSPWENLWVLLSFGRGCYRSQPLSKTTLSPLR